MVDGNDIAIISTASTAYLETYNNGSANIRGEYFFIFEADSFGTYTFTSLLNNMNPRVFAVEPGNITSMRFLPYLYHLPTAEVSHQLNPEQQVIVVLSRTIGGAVPAGTGVRLRIDEGPLDFRWPMPSHLSYIRREPLRNSVGGIVEVPRPINSPFGFRTFDNRIHFGIDFGTQGQRLSVYSIGEGIVESIGWITGGGESIVIKHRNGFRSRYLHLTTNSIQVSEEQGVYAGQLIALSGDTATPGAFHLHLDIFVDGTGDRSSQMNPLPWFHWDDRRQQEGIVNPNPFFIVQNDEFVFNQNFDWNFDWREWQYRNPHDLNNPITN